MNKDTYETETISTALESWEWDDMWRIKANDLKTDRILLIGDSISRGYRHAAAAVFEGEIHVDNLATSKGIDNPHFLKTIELMMNQEPNCKIIHFNNGLHGWHLSEEDYYSHYDALIGELIKKYPDVKIIIGLSTPLRVQNDVESFDPRNERVLKRNEMALKVAGKYNLAVTDLYGAIADTHKYHAEDGVHLYESGYEILAEVIGKKIREVL